MPEGRPSFSLYWRKYLTFFGQLKTAIILLSIFALALITGTFVESYHGTDFANRLIYKSLPFMLLQFLLFQSILAALFLRLPLRKKLAGFYIVHLGLILLWAGSFITYTSGIDGSMTLTPKNPGRILSLPKDTLVLSWPHEKRSESLELPYVTFKTTMQQETHGIKILEFYPFAQLKQQWVPFVSEGKKSFHSSQYQLKNDRFAQEMTLSLHPDSIEDFPSSLTLGPLNVHYLPQELSQCFARLAQEPSQKLLLWNMEEQNCQLLGDFKIKMQRTKEGKNFFVLNRGGRQVTFFPDFSPYPLDKNFQVVTDFPLRPLNVSLFEGPPHLFLFGDKAAFYSKVDQHWHLVDVDKKKPTPLPWMGFTLTLLEHSLTYRPQVFPIYTLPLQENGQMVEGNLKAVKIQYGEKVVWVTSQRPQMLETPQGPLQIEIKNQEFHLPFELSLDRFHMEKDPGTQTPASFESYITLFHETGSEDHHVYMNHPLIFKGMTFYQASYFPLEEDQGGGYGSVLSANIDPGRNIKYLGSLFLVLGAILYYVMNKDRFHGKPHPHD